MAVDLVALRSALLAALDAITIATADESEEFEGVNLAFYFANRGHVEHDKPGFGNRLMLEQYRRMREEHPFVPNLRDGIMGTGGGAPNPKSWDTHGRIMDAAERGELNHGAAWTINRKPFKRWDYLGLSTVDKHAALLAVWNSIKGREWRSHPANLPVLPNGEPQL